MSLRVRSLSRGRGLRQLFCSYLALRALQCASEHNSCLLWLGGRVWACAVRLSVLALYAQPGCAPAVFIPAELPLKSVDVLPCLVGLVQGMFELMCFL